MSMIAHIKFPTHSAHITQDDSGVIYCFKYTENVCDYDEFIDEFEAADFLFNPLPIFKYQLTLEQE